MRLIPDWKKTIVSAWSSRLALIGVLLSSADALLPQLDGLVPRWAFIGIYLLIFCVRVIYQESLNGDKPADQA